MTDIVQFSVLVDVFTDVVQANVVVDVMVNRVNVVKLIREGVADREGGDDALIRLCKNWRRSGTKKHRRHMTGVVQFNVAVEVCTVVVSLGEMVDPSGCGIVDEWFMVERKAAW